MKIKSSAPGKIILFGEHTVVYNKPAIAVAINKGVNVELIPRDDDIITINVPLIDYVDQNTLIAGHVDYNRKNGTSLITDYIHEVIELFEFKTGFDLLIDINLHLGAGLGSSAAVTVACMKAISYFAGFNYDNQLISNKSQAIEIKIQGAASPIDTSMSTYGGMIYIDEDSKLNRIDNIMDLPLIIAFCDKKGNTGELVESVRQKYFKYPIVLNDIFNALKNIAIEAMNTLESDDSIVLGELMNINQGLLDSIGVNTIELSDMIDIARSNGAYGAKLTGSGGGGSIIAYCPENIDVIEKKLNKEYTAFKCEHSKKGVTLKIIE